MFQAATYWTAAGSYQSRSIVYRVDGTSIDHYTLLFIMNHNVLLASHLQVL